MVAGSARSWGRLLSPPHVGRWPGAMSRRSAGLRRHFRIASESLREMYEERGAIWRVALHAQPAAVPSNDPLRDGKAEPRALATRDRPEAALLVGAEDRVELVDRDA